MAYIKILWEEHIICLLKATAKIVQHNRATQLHLTPPRPSGSQQGWKIVLPSHTDAETHGAKARGTARWGTTGKRHIEEKDNKIGILVFLIFYPVRKTVLPNSTNFTSRVVYESMEVFRTASLYVF